VSPFAGAASSRTIGSAFTTAAELMFALLVDANAHAMFGSDPAVHVGDGRFVLTFVLLPIGS
jgi:hypothetical protein